MILPRLPAAAALLALATLAPAPSRAQAAPREPKTVHIEDGEKRIPAKWHCRWEDASGNLPAAPGLRAAGAVLVLPPNAPAVLAPELAAILESFGVPVLVPSLALLPAASAAEPAPGEATAPVPADAEEARRRIGLAVEWIRKRRDRPAARVAVVGVLQGVPIAAAHFAADGSDLALVAFAGKQSGEARLPAAGSVRVRGRPVLVLQGEAMYRTSLLASLSSGDTVAKEGQDGNVRITRPESALMAVGSWTARQLESLDVDGVYDDRSKEGSTMSSALTTSPAGIGVYFRNAAVATTGIVLEFEERPAAPRAVAADDAPPADPPPPKRRRVRFTPGAEGRPAAVERSVWGGESWTTETLEDAVGRFAVGDSTLEATLPWGVAGIAPGSDVLWMPLHGKDLPSREAPPVRWPDGNERVPRDAQKAEAVDSW